MKKITLMVVIAAFLLFGKTAHAQVRKPVQLEQFIDSVIKDYYAYLNRASLNIHYWIYLDSTLKVSVLKKSADGSPALVRAAFNRRMRDHREVEVKDWLEMAFDGNTPYIMVFAKGKLHDRTPEEEDIINTQSYINPLTKAFNNPQAYGYTQADIEKYKALQQKFLKSEEEENEKLFVSRYLKVLNEQKKTAGSVSIMSCLEKSRQQRLEATGTYYTNEIVLKAGVFYNERTPHQTYTPREVSVVKNICTKTITIYGITKDHSYGAPDDIVYKDASIDLKPGQTTDLMEIQPFYDDKTTMVGTTVYYLKPFK
ncbi:MAG TPA: hypothetical protein VI233_18305 [Puia sp.]